MPARSYKIFINGERWRLNFCCVPASIYGDCDYQKKVIRIDSKLYGETKLDTMLHELIHARWPDLCETSVCEFASELAAILTREGFTDEYSC
jgi:hypothetical protein